jgi:hypothetical protein
MTTLALADVCDPDCIVSMVPLVWDAPSTEKYARGAAAILRRILYAWLRAGLTQLDGASLTRADLVALRSQYEGLAEAEDYVLSCSLTLDDAAGSLNIAASVKLVDGRTYDFEVTAGAAASITFPEAA